jgi:hypothetical protein
MFLTMKEKKIVINQAYPGKCSNNSGMMANHTRAPQKVLAIVTSAKGISCQVPSVSYTPPPSPPSLLTYIFIFPF